MKTKKKVSKSDLIFTKKVKISKPKFRLVSYTMGATIPVGMYANIQPSVTVEAETMEIAERAAMAHIEALFAKYRVPQSPTNTGAPLNTKSPVVAASAQPAQVPINTGATAQKAPEVPLSQAPANEIPAIVLSEPFKRAKGAIESCMSYDALKLVGDQIEKSVKLIDSEKAELKTLVMTKTNDLTLAGAK